MKEQEKRGNLRIRLGGKVEWMSARNVAAMRKTLDGISSIPRILRSVQ
jgi:hypothetical protein